MEDIYNFSNNEKETIKRIKEILNKNNLSDYDLYKYDLYVSGIVAEIKGIDKKELNERYNSLPIKNKKDINITANQICEILNQKPGAFLKEIFEELEINILNKNINNDLNSLTKYILNTKI